jgi:hypothetical protein
MTVTRSATPLRRTFSSAFSIASASYSMAATRAAPELGGRDGEHRAAGAEVGDDVARAHERRAALGREQADDAARRRVVAGAERHAGVDHHRTRRVAPVGQPRRYHVEGAERVRADERLPPLGPVDVGRGGDHDLGVRVRRQHGGAHGADVGAGRELRDERVAVLVQALRAGREQRGRDALGGRGARGGIGSAGRERPSVGGPPGRGGA